LTAVTTSCTGTDVCDAQPDVHSTAAAAYPLGTSRFECTASDDAGNVLTTSCDVVIVDTTWPIVECAGETVECTANRSADATVTGSAADICDGDVDITGTGTASYAVGFHTMQVIATDDAGNATSCDATVIVEDTTAPRIMAMAGDDVYECGEDYVEHGATAFDICDGDLSEDIVTDTSNVDTSTPTSGPGDPNDTPYVVHYSVVDGSGNRSTASRDITVLRYFSGDGGILWDQPLPDSASGPDHTDPSGLATPDPADDYKFPFTQNRTIPVKVRALNKWGTDVTADPSISARLSVYADANCDLVPDGDAIDIDHSGVGGPGGLMQLAGGHFHYNLATKNWPGKHDGCFILEATASVTGPCDDSHTERVSLQRKR
jgi:hypothetical protein